jgi:hypothetical protein
MAGTCWRLEIGDQRSDEPILAASGPPNADL